ncbi:MAG: ATP-binding cassette domain-containing protein [Saprospiraceae bacterium]
MDFTGLDKNDVRSIRMKVGMLFQGSALFDSLTVEENIRFPLDMFTNMTFKEKLNRVNFCLERVNLAGNNKKYPSELSGGMQKRVGIARAIVLKPKYLFCDEPNSGLDPKTSILIDELISDITKENKITTIINTHDMNSVMEAGDNICFLFNGMLEWSGSKDGSWTQPTKTCNHSFLPHPSFSACATRPYVNFLLDKQGVFPVFLSQVSKTCSDLPGFPGRLRAFPSLT